MITRHWRSLSGSRAFYPMCYVLLALIYLWPLTLHPNFVPARPNDPSSDLLLTHLPNAEYIRESLVKFGQLPLWNTQILAGQPFAADPQAGLWYPPYWLLFFLPLPFAFNLLFVLHLAWAGYGVFRFLCAEGLSHAPASFGGLAFAGTPMLVAHLGAGHVTLVFAVAWVPWVLLAARHAAYGGGLRRGAWVGSLLALIFHIHLQWGFYTTLLGVTFWLVRWARLRAAGAEGGSAWAAARAAGAWAGLCFSLEAIFLIPFVEFIRYSGRGALTLEEAALYSLPPYPYLLGLFVPIYGVVHEWVTYVGLVTLLLAVLGIRRRPFFWLATLIFSAAFALGSNFVLFPPLFHGLPGLSFLRVPARLWLFVALGLCILAAHGMQVVLTEVLPRLRDAAKFPLLARLIPSARALFPLLVMAALVDLLRMNASELTARPLPDPAPAAKWIGAQPGLFRVYSPSGSLPLPDPLQHVEGVSPVHLLALRDFVARASGIPAQGYSVSVPFYWVDEANPDPARQRAASSPDARLLGLLNVGYVAADFPLNAPGLALVQTFGRTLVYENNFARPRAWLAEGGAVEIRAWSPNRIVMSAVGPGLLILSEVAYPGWEARVDGDAAPVETVEGLLRGVWLGAGQHIVMFEFRPWTVYTGALITVLGLVALAGIGLWAK